MGSTGGEDIKEQKGGDASSNAKIDDDVPEIKLPLPLDGIEYTKVEAVSHIIKYPKKSRERARAVALIIERKLVKAGRTQLYELVSKVEKNPDVCIDTPWTKAGRQPLLSFSLGNGAEISRWSTDKYKAILSVMKSNAIINKTVPKTETRRTAGYSWIGSAALLHLIATTHYYVAPTVCKKTEEDMKSAHFSVRQLYDMVSEAYGRVPVRVVKSHLVLSTDDTTMYVYEGTLLPLE